MRRSLLRSAPLLLGLSIALLAQGCNDGATSSPAVQPQPDAGTPPGEQPGSTSGDPLRTPPAPTSTTPEPPGPTPEPPWMPPVVATTSMACGVAQPDATSADFTTPSGRTFHVWGPKNYDASKTYPVVVMFHGWYANGEAFQSWFEMEKYVQNAAFVVYPDAIGGLWDLNGDKDLLFFDEMVKQLGETYCINPSRVLGFGFSYGGHFADHLGCKRAGYVKAITVGNGGPGGNRQKCGRLPLLVTTRTLDTDELPAYGLDVVAGWMQLNTCGAAGANKPQTNPGNGEGMGYCRTHAGCKAPGAITYCEDTSAFAPASHPEWNHTVREYYRSYAFKWFQALP